MKLIAGVLSLVYYKTIKSNSSPPQRGNENQVSLHVLSYSNYSWESELQDCENAVVASLRDALGSASSERWFAAGRTASPGLGQGWSDAPRGGRTPAGPSVSQELQIQERDLFAWDIFSDEEGKGLPEGSTQQ